MDETHIWEKICWSTSVKWSPTLSRSEEKLSTIKWGENPQIWALRSTITPLLGKYSYFPFYWLQIVSPILGGNALLFSLHILHSNGWVWTTPTHNYQSPFLWPIKIKCSQSYLNKIKGLNIRKEIEKKNKYNFMLQNMNWIKYVFLHYSKIISWRGSTSTVP